MQFIKNCFRDKIVDGYFLMNKDYRKYNIIDNCYYSNSLKKVVHYTNFGIEFIPKEYLKEYKHQFVTQNYCSLIER